MNYILPKKIIIAFGLVLLFFAFCPFSLADNLKDAFNVTDKKPLVNFADKAGYDPAQSQIEPMIAKIIQAVLSFLGVVFLILIIYAGYTWMTASGNEQQIEKAKKTLTASVIGLIIVISAYAISVFVVKRIGDSALQQSQPESQPAAEGKKN